MKQDDSISTQLRTQCTRRDVSSRRAPNPLRLQLLSIHPSSSLPLSSPRASTQRVPALPILHLTRQCPTRFIDIPLRNSLAIPIQSARLTRHWPSSCEGERKPSVQHWQSCHSRLRARLFVCSRWHEMKKWRGDDGVDEGDFGTNGELEVVGREDMVSMMLTMAGAAAEGGGGWDSPRLPATPLISLLLIRVWGVEIRFEGWGGG